MIRARTDAHIRPAFVLGFDDERSMTVVWLRDLHKTKDLPYVPSLDIIGDIPLKLEVGDYYLFCSKGLHWLGITLSGSHPTSELLGR